MKLKQKYDSSINDGSKSITKSKRNGIYGDTT